jgi:hypothetical protein
MGIFRDQRKVENLVQEYETPGCAPEFNGTSKELHEWLRIAETKMRKRDADRTKLAPGKLPHRSDAQRRPEFRIDPDVLRDHARQFNSTVK